MNRKTFINYIAHTEHIELVADLIPYKINGREIPLFIFSCNILIDEKVIPVELWVTKKFPQHLPIFFLPKDHKLGFLPHIGPNGIICFLEKESIYINAEEPEIVFQASVEMAIQTLKDGLSGANHQDFREEFQVFWENNTHKSPRRVLSFIEVGKMPKKIQVLKDPKKVLVFDSHENIDQKREAIFKNQKPIQKAGLYIPLILDYPIMPPKYDELWTINQFIAWLKPQISKENWETLIGKLLNLRPSRFEFLIIGIPRNTGSPLLIGIQLKPKKKTSHPLLSKNSTWGLTLLQVNRLDTAALLPRGGASLSLQSKHILLIGCGSVGSHVAVSLAKTGIGQLTLVDNDLLKIENIQRFAIGFEHADKAKVIALKEYLSKNYFYTHTTAISKIIETLIEEKNLDFNQYDLIISATGDPTINLYLNEIVKKEEVASPLLIGWNESFGIGGHALLSLPTLSGCYRCLFKNRYNTASFAAEEQSKPFHRKHLGCGEVYTPYGALDSIRTSELMTRLAIQYLEEKIDQGQILSWKGDSLEFKNQGFALSTRYDKQTQDQMNNLRFDFINSECPHCIKKP